MNELQAIIEEAKLVAINDGVDVMVCCHDDGEVCRYWLDSSLLDAAEKGGVIVAVVEPSGEIHVD